MPKTEIKATVPAGYEEVGGLNIWIPETAGDELKGTIIEVQDNQYGKQFVIQPDGTTDAKAQLLTPSHKVLQNRLSKCVKGDLVLIVYDGAQPPAVKGQNPMEMYTVFKKKA